MLLFSHTFRTLQRLSPAICDAIDDPVPVILTCGQVTFFENREMIGEFRAGEVHEPVDDADTERLIFYQVQDRESQRI